MNKVLLGRIKIGLLALLVSLPLVAQAATTLDQDFATPPPAAKPMVWWHWMGRSITKEGITKDLEAMQAAGIGGATIFNLTSSVQGYAQPFKNTPWPENEFRGPTWWALVEHAAKEADRLGLNLGMHNAPGYSGTGGPWITPQMSMKVVVWSTASVKGGTVYERVLTQPPTKLEFYRDIGVVAVPSVKAGELVPMASIKDITAQMRADGVLKWTAPEGDWVVYRFGYTSTGKSGHPAPEELTSSLECDKLSAEYSRFHFEQVLKPLKEHLGQRLGTVLKHITLDSYEAGNLNWTEGFRDEFIKRRGYDLLTWLPTLNKVVIGDADLSARFAWDYKTTISDLFIQNNFRQGKAIMNTLGVRMYLEPYTGPFNTVEAAAVPDMTMGEFWTPGGGGIGRHIVGPAQAAGMNIIGSEAFTSKPMYSDWSETPAKLKVAGDSTWISGVNQLFLHHWVHQPFGDNIKPGLGMGWWGTHFGRNQTWYEPGKAWLAYLGRSQALLQRGEPVSDYLTLDEAAGADNRTDVIAAADLVAGASVKDGRIILPSGRSYAFIVLPKSPLMLPATARKLKALVEAGAVLAGPLPERSPSFQDYPHADSEVAALGKDFAAQAAQGKYFATPALALAALKIDAGLKVTTAGLNVRSIQRRDGATDLYFVANPTEATQRGTVSLRVTGKVPELWDSMRQTNRSAPAWRIKDGRTEVDLDLDSADSVFIILRQPTQKTASAPLAQPAPGPTPLTVDGPWEVVYKKVGQMTADQTVTLPTLTSWTLSETPAIKYYSGTAVYKKSITFTADWVGSKRPVRLDLGVVKELARIRVNGIDCGVAWKAPHWVDISQALKVGANAVEIEVTNTWANRLIGDEQETADSTFIEAEKRWKDKDGKPLSVGRMLGEFPEWMMKNQPRPGNRVGFCSWNYFTKNSPLLDAGLLGPVQVRMSD